MAVDQSPPSALTLDYLLLEREIEDFLYDEAELLDTRQFAAWLDLLAEDVRYWMPMRRNIKFDNQEFEDTREQHDINWFDEGKDTLTQRVKQILTGVHWAEEPLSRVCHMVSNVRLQQVQPCEVQVKSRFLIYRNRQQNETDFFVGKREDTLRRIEHGWQIARRKIILDQNVLMAKNLTIFF